jgi:hypothetical protein
MIAKINKQDFINQCTTMQGLIDMGAVVLPAISIVALISIVGIMALPVMIPLWIYCYINSKSEKNKSEINVRKELQGI